MKAAYEIKAPGKIVVRLEMTMPLEDWTTLAHQLDEKWPSSDLHRLISDLAVKMATRVAYVEEE